MQKSDTAENNNGWMTISGEDDLPKQAGEYWVMHIHEGLKKFDFDPSLPSHRRLFAAWHTHWQPITVPEKPLF